ncbi:hypothetical protein [Pseudomonas phage PA1C]|uniref:Uncharacterized protein n=1 Tax=Pseudomonas phage vB_PaeM_PS119XW TaxID=2601632 RepID=A0A5C1K7T3_9CAUD|nr:hypothetical protein PP933_gp211 [Pseudomonas phage vB_PaeM_PS119XW]QBX32366.1 hypothetical protein [Pseudomonas phage PA1C]QEM41940.1 hypothetical protein [Pseudomonas phage vB_PaeM_PS119XW]BEG72456.1 hypothetical protein RVBP21_0840 [Pseudomonas phage BRkr]
MQNQSNNVVLSQNIAVLTAAAELGAEALLRSIGGDTSAATLEGEYLTKEDIQAAIVARMCKFLG